MSDKIIHYAFWRSEAKLAPTMMARVDDMFGIQLRQGYKNREENDKTIRNGKNFFPSSLTIYSKTL